MSETHVTSLFPPQRYELSRLGKFNNFDSLLDYAAERSKIGTDRFFSVSRIFLHKSIFLSILETNHAICLYYW